MQGYSHSISLSYRKKVFDDIRSVLTCVGGEKLLQRFSDGCFGHLMRFIGGVSCSKALHELISREITFPEAKRDELWFRVGETNIRFALAEYALVTGLHFGSSTFDPLGSHEMPPEGLFMRLRKGRPVTAEHLWGLFNLQRMSMSPEDYLKVAHVLALHLMALGYDQSRRIEPWVWVLVEDLDQWNSFPWGAYTYQALVHSVSILPTKRGNIKHRLRYFISGPVWALQVYDLHVYCLFNFVFVDFFYSSWLALFYRFGLMRLYHVYQICVHRLARRSVCPDVLSGHSLQGAEACTNIFWTGRYHYHALRDKIALLLPHQFFFRKLGQKQN